MILFTTTFIVSIFYRLYIISIIVDSFRLFNNYNSLYHVNRYSSNINVNNNNKNANNYINNNEHSLFAIDQSSQSKGKSKVLSPQSIKVNRLFEKNDRFPLSSLQLGQKMRGRIISIVE